MTIAISASGADLDAQVDPRFGRCPYFIIVDPMTREFQTIENTSSGQSGGAGISAAQMIVNKGVQAVLTGNCGPNAHQVLSAAKTEIITGVSGRISDVVEEFKLGTYIVSRQPNVADHYGMGGRGGGMGRGMGQGMGRGLRNMGPAPDPGRETGAAENDLEVLKQQSQQLASQLAEIQKKIQKLENP